jgi:hypothetical protein
VALLMMMLPVGAATMVELAAPAVEAVPARLVTMQLGIAFAPTVAPAVNVILIVPAPAVIVPLVIVQA